MSSTQPFYVHGTSSAEQSRLSDLNMLINDACLHELALCGDERIIDFGCGLMQLSRAMARAVRGCGRGVVVGIERDAAQRAEGLRQAESAGERDLVDLRAGDATDPPLTSEEWGTFDLAHARFLLEHVSQPLAIVRQMVRAVRPGGRIVLLDDDHATLRLAPECPGFNALWRAYIETYLKAGNDPFVGRNLVPLLHRAGARPVRNTFLFFGSCAGNPTWPLITGNMLRILEGAREAIIALGGLSEQVLGRSLTGFREWCARPDAAVWYAINWAEGRRPEEPQPRSSTPVSPPVGCST